MKKKPYKGNRALGEVAEKWLYGACEEVGAEQVHILHYKIKSDWGKLFGPEIANYSRPLSLSFYKDKTTGGLLLVEADSPSAALILKTQEQVIISKITHYFGYKAVNSLRIKVKPLQAPASKSQASAPLPQPLTDEESERLFQTLQSIEDEESRELLASIAMRSFEVK